MFAPSSFLWSHHSQALPTGLWWIHRWLGYSKDPWFSARLSNLPCYDTLISNMILYDTMVNFCMLSLKSSFSLVENSKEPLPGALEHVTPIPTDLTDLELFRKYRMPIGDVWNEVSCSQKKNTFAFKTYRSILRHAFYIKNVKGSSSLIPWNHWPASSHAILVWRRSFGMWYFILVVRNICAFHMDGILGL